MGVKHIHWVGGKSNLIPQLARYVPDNFENYYEPFFGGGALFFHLKERGLIHNDAFLSDKNKYLIRMYSDLRGDLDRVIVDLDWYLNNGKDKSSFYRVRDAFPDESRSVGSQFIYINKLGFNGLWRVNSFGKVNITYGQNENRLVYDVGELNKISGALQSAVLRECSYVTACENVGEGDFVYLDPPYYDKRKTNGGLYSEGELNHVRLRDLALDMARRGAYVMISNSAESAFLYGDGFFVHNVSAGRSFTPKSSDRGKKSEVLVTTYKKEL